LTEKGLLDSAAGKARGTHLCSRRDSVVYLPLVGSVVAGHPVVSEECTDKEIAVPSFMTPAGSAFLLRVRGDSMEGAGIIDGDIVVVRQTSQPSEHDIVVVTVDGETTLKRLARIRGSWFLAPDNPKYAAIRLATDQSVVHGVVTGVMRSMNRDGRRFL
jgi:repressor LexA